MVKCILMSDKLGRKEGFCPEDIFKFSKNTFSCCRPRYFQSSSVGASELYEWNPALCLPEFERTQLKSNNE